MTIYGEKYQMETRYVYYEKLQENSANIEWVEIETVKVVSSQKKRAISSVDSVLADFTSLIKYLISDTHRTYSLPNRAVREVLVDAIVALQVHFPNQIMQARNAHYTKSIIKMNPRLFFQSVYLKYQLRKRNINALLQIFKHTHLDLVDSITKINCNEWYQQEEFKNSNSIKSMNLEELFNKVTPNYFLKSSLRLLKKRQLTNTNQEVL